MVSKILHNNYTRKVKLVEIKPGRNNEFFIWNFEDNRRNKYVGFTSTTVYFGNKTHLWYSLLIGYFLPHSYTINFDNVIGKECNAVLDQKNIVRSIIPVENAPQTTTAPSGGYNPVPKDVGKRPPPTPVSPPPKLGPVEPQGEEPDESLFY